MTPGTKLGRPRTERVDGGNCMLTEQLSDKILTAARRLRVFDSQVALYCGISPNTLKNWITWGLLPDAKEPYRTFAEEYTKVQITQEAWALRQIRRGTKGCDAQWRPGDWKAAAWYLERRFPRRWSPSFQPASGPTEAFDVEAILTTGEQRLESLTEVLKNATPELEAAMRAAAQEIRAVLDAEPLQETGLVKNSG